MTTTADPVPGGRPGDPSTRSSRAAELAAAGVTAVALSWVDTAGINRVKTVPVTALDRAATWGVGMSPVFDTFLADDSIVATDVLGGPDGDLRLYPDLDELVPLAGQPGWAWAPVDRITQDGAVHPACTRTLLRHLVSAAGGRRRDVPGQHRDRVRSRAARRRCLRAGLPWSRVRDDQAGRAERVQRRAAAGAGRGGPRGRPVPPRVRGRAI
jgi:hypothetical protein